MQNAGFILFLLLVIASPIISIIATWRNSTMNKYAKVLAGLGIGIAIGFLFLFVAFMIMMSGWGC
jgi:hypothetical protein